MKRIIFALSLLTIGFAWASEGKEEAGSKEIKAYAAESSVFEVLLDKVKVIDGTQIDKQKTSLEAVKFIRNLSKYLSGTLSFKNKSDKVIFLGIVQQLLRLQGETPSAINSLFKFLDSLPKAEKVTKDQQAKILPSLFETATPLILLYTNLYYQAQKNLGRSRLTIIENINGVRRGTSLMNPERILQFREEVLSPKKSGDNLKI